MTYQTPKDLSDVASQLILKELRNHRMISESAYSVNDFYKDIMVAHPVDYSRQKVDAFVISDVPPLRRLAALNLLESEIPKNITFVLVSPSAFYPDALNSSSELSALAEHIEGIAPILWDVREDDLFARHEASLLSNSGQAFTGSASAAIMSSIQKHQLCRLASGFVRHILYDPETNKNANRRMSFFEFSAKDAQDIANTVLCGEEHISLADKKTRRVANWKVEALDWIALLPSNNDRIYRETRKMESLSDAMRIWEYAISSGGNHGLMKAIGKDEPDKIALSTKLLIEALQEFAERYGVNEMMDAWASGVAIDDITA